MKKATHLGTGLLLCTALSSPAFSANVLVWGGNSNADITTFLNGAGHVATNNGGAIPTAADLVGIDVAVLMRSTGNADVETWVQNGGCLITEWSGASWALSQGLINASVASSGGIGLNTPVTITADGIAASLATGIANPYTAGGASEFFHTYAGIGPSVSVMATRPGGIPAILGDTFGLGAVLANGIDWGDGFAGSGADNQQLLLNSIEGFCQAPASGGSAEAVPVMSLLGATVLAGLMGLAGMLGLRRTRSS